MCNLISTEDVILLIALHSGNVLFFFPISITLVQLNNTPNQTVLNVSKRTISNFIMKNQFDIQSCGRQHISAQTLQFIKKINLIYSIPFLPNPIFLCTTLAQVGLILRNTLCHPITNIFRSLISL